MLAQLLKQFNEYWSRFLLVISALYLHLPAWLHSDLLKVTTFLMWAHGNQ